MRCPACNEPLIVLEYQAFEIDYCTHCKGVWLDAGELETLFGDAVACAAFLTIGSPADAHGEALRRCPRCGVKMTKEATESDPPILFDNCPRGDGLWFDRGELDDVLHHSTAFDQKGSVASWLRDMFAADLKDPGE